VEVALADEHKDLWEQTNINRVEIAGLKAVVTSIPDQLEKLAAAVQEIKIYCAQCRTAPAVATAGSAQLIKLLLGAVVVLTGALGVLLGIQ
jgi:hypothetical protein